ncbi:MAG: dinitrogenase iron-molybdenum cofactor [Clostridium sp.]|nr:dinitrogenase iron-molybdenum cofactor [Clostridium sp.]
MKIAVASNQGIVSGHFGKSQGFDIFESEGKDVKPLKTLTNDGHEAGIHQLVKENVDVLIVGGMGQKAMVKLKENNIEVICGAEGETFDAARACAEGTLESKGSLCEGDHNHEGHDHHHG